MKSSGPARASVAVLIASLVAAEIFASPPADSPPLIGERPAVLHHIVGDGRGMTIPQLFDAGEILFNARFNILDGQGRPATTGAGAPRAPLQPSFIRTSAPDSTSCAGCHSQPRSGGAGDFVANVFVLAQTLDPVTESIAPDFSNERNTPGMMGSGPIEMLAREMTADLLAIRERARSDAVATGEPATRELVAKGVHFGFVTVRPDGRVDPSRIEGVDWDLVVKPFHQKGAVVSLREFTNNAMNHHHGMQSIERFGPGDPDDDGVSDELTVGDITATVIYQAALNTPGRLWSSDPRVRAAAREGERVFNTIGCAACHVPQLELRSRFFTEPSPYNPAGNLHPGDVPGIVSFDMTIEGEKPRIERARDGGAIVRAFTDLKRHNLNDADYNHFANEMIPQGRLNGNEDAADFTIAPLSRPTTDFLTRKLWDVGNTAPYGHRGDLTTMTEAIYYHGGEARAVRDAFFALPKMQRDEVIEFLRTLQIVPPGSALETVGPAPRPAG